MFKTWIRSGTIISRFGLKQIHPMIFGFFRISFASTLLSCLAAAVDRKWIIDRE
jgi:hypothetical protein